MRRKLENEGDSLNPKKAKNEGKRELVVDNSISIFQFIPLPLWPKIFESFHPDSKEEKETLKSLRLVCKIFPNFNFSVFETKYSL